MRGKKAKADPETLPPDVIQTGRAFLDHEIFCTESCSIRDKHGLKVPFYLQPAQKRLREKIAECRAKRRPVRIVVLKARQVMISAGTAAEFFHEVPFKPGQKALIVAHEEKSAKEIFSYYHQLNEFYVPFRGLGFLPAVTKDADDSGELEYENGSWFHIHTANNLKGGRSFSLRFLHLSELAFWRNAKVLMAGLMQSVPDDPDTVVVIESTANGVGGHFYQLCQEAMDPASDSEWVFLFFAWWEHPEYSKPVAAPAEFEASLSKEEEELRQRYNLTLAQLNWRRWCIVNNCQGSVDLFKQEYPSNPQEAFLFSGRPRFSHQHLSRMPIDEHGLAGDLTETVNGPRTLTYFMPAEKGLLTLYRKPAPRHEYIIGVDVAEGIDIGEGVIGEIDPDWSVATILDRDSGEEVAQLRGRLEPDPFGDYLVALARWYSNSETGNPAFVVPEANGPGIALMEAMLRRDFPPARIYHRRPSPDDQFSEDTQNVLSKLGWRTNNVTRVQLISKLDQCIREFSVLIRNPGTQRECQTFVIKVSGKAEHSEGCHDDRVLALALGAIGIEQAPPDRRMRAVQRFRAAEPTASRGTRSYGKRRSPERERGELIRL